MNLDRRLLDDDGAIDLDAWLLRERASLGVGTCRCGGVLVAAGHEKVWRVVWFTIRCSGCGSERCSPNGRLASNLARR